MTSADSATASATSPATTRSGHRRRHKRSSKKHPKVPGEMSPNTENAAEVSGTSSSSSPKRAIGSAEVSGASSPRTPKRAKGDAEVSETSSSRGPKRAKGPAEVSGTSSPHSSKRSNESRKASSDGAGAAWPDLNSTVPATDADSPSIPAPAPKVPPEPVSAAPEKSPYELPEPGASERPVPGYASPTASAREIAVAQGTWTPFKTTEDERNQAKIVWPIIVAALIVGLVAAYIFSMMVYGHRATWHLHVHNMHAANDTGAFADADHPDGTLAGWTNDDGGTAASQRAP